MAEGLTAARTLGGLEEQVGELTLEEVGRMEGDWVSPAWRAYFIQDGIRFCYEWSSDAARQSDPAVAIWEEYLDGMMSQ